LRNQLQNACYYQNNGGESSAFALGGKQVADIEKKSSHEDFSEDTDVGSFE